MTMMATHQKECTPNTKTMTEIQRYIQEFHAFFADKQLVDAPLNLIATVTEEFMASNAHWAKAASTEEEANAMKASYCLFLMFIRERLGITYTKARLLLPQMWDKSGIRRMANETVLKSNDYVLDAFGTSVVQALTNDRIEPHTASMLKAYAKYIKEELDIDVDLTINDLYMNSVTWSVSAEKRLFAIWLVASNNCYKPSDAYVMAAVTHNSIYKSNGQGLNTTSFRAKQKTIAKHLIPMLNTPKNMYKQSCYSMYVRLNQSLKHL